MHTARDPARTRVRRAGAMDVGCGAMGMGATHGGPAWMATAALGGLMRSPGARVRFPADVSTAMALSSSTSGFLLAGALQLDHWASLTSNFIEQFRVGSRPLFLWQAFLLFSGCAILHAHAVQHSLAGVLPSGIVPTLGVVSF